MAEVFSVSVDYLLDEAESSNSYQVKDKQLQRYIELADQLSEDDKKIVKGVVEALLIKNKVKDLTSFNSDM